jgi:hypothetical protein
MIDYATTILYRLYFLDARVMHLCFFFFPCDITCAFVNGYRCGKNATFLTRFEDQIHAFVATATGKIDWYEWQVSVEPHFH